MKTRALPPGSSSTTCASQILSNSERGMRTLLVERFQRRNGPSHRADDGGQGGGDDVRIDPDPPSNLAVDGQLDVGDRRRPFDKLSSEQRLRMTEVSVQRVLGVVPDVDVDAERARQAVDGGVRWGVGIDANIVTASLAAIVSAVGRSVPSLETLHQEGPHAALAVR